MLPKVAGSLMKPVKRSDCLPQDKKEYSVVELEKGFACAEDQAEDLEEKLSALQRAVKRREKALGDLQKNQSGK